MHHIAFNIVAMTPLAQKPKRTLPKCYPAWCAVFVMCTGEIDAQSTPLVSELASEVSFKGLKIAPEAGQLEILTQDVIPELNLSAHTRVQLHPQFHRDEFDGPVERFTFFSYHFILHRPEGDTTSEAIPTKISFDASGTATPIHELNLRGLAAWADSKIMVGLIGQSSKYSYDFGATSPRDA